MGTYQAEFTFKGVHRRKTLQTGHLKIAKRKAVEIDKPLSDGTYDPSISIFQKETQMNLKQAITDFIAFHKTEGNRHRTVGRYQGILDELRKFANSQGVLSIPNVTLGLIDKYRAHRNEKSHFY